MPIAYIATLGQRPEAITVAFDLLHPRYDYRALGVLHTDARASGVAEAYHKLRAFLRSDPKYAAIPSYFHPVTDDDDNPLIDIDDQQSATAYYRSVLRVLYRYKQDGWTLHLMIAGGRKAMSIYATLAAARVFQQHDRVWTVLSSEALMAQSGQFRVPPGMRDQVQLVDLPMSPARIAPEVAIDDLLSAPKTNASVFLAKLSDKEREVAEALRRHPYASNAELGEMLSKSERTVENQLGAIYTMLTGFLDLGERISNKRQALLDLLREE